MIVPMKKITLLCSNDTQEEALQSLQQAGLVHLFEPDIPADSDLDQAREDMKRLERILAALEAHAAPAPSPMEMTAEQAAGRIWKLLQRLHTMQDRIQDLTQEKQRIQPFGAFDPQSIRALEQNGVHLALCAIPKNRDVDVPPQAAWVEVSADRTIRYVALFSLGTISPPGLEVTLPEYGLAEVEQELMDLKEEQAAIGQELASLSIYRPSIAGLLDQASDRVCFARARAGMETMGPVAFIQGFVPEYSQKAIIDLARNNGWGMDIAEPGPNDHPPTLIHTPAWVRPIQAVLAILNIVPSYRETDISAPFLLFLSLFFAMIIGDAGYGTLFLGFTLLSRRYLDRVQPELFSFLLIMSLSTLIWGLLVGNVLGTSPSGPVLSRMQIDWFSGPYADDRLILLCFLLGAVHLSLGHIWQMVILWPSLRVLAQVGWLLLTWVMFFAARSLVLMRVFPSAALWLLSLGLLLIVFFMHPMRSGYKQWTEYIRLPLDVISHFVDLVSYIRLFAVGTATLAMAQAFNRMALDLGSGSVIGSLGAALILFLGHGLNIILATMGVLVHGVRLNTLEFATHAGITWSGTKFQPFAVHDKDSTLSPADRKYFDPQSGQKKEHLPD